MPIRRLIVWIVAMLALGSSALSGQDYPGKAILIVTSEAGSGNDFNARLVAQELSGPLGQQLIVENRASSLIAITQAAKAQPDGYTLLAMAGALWLLPLMQDVPYVPTRDFAPISLTYRSSSVLVVNASVSANSVKELIALAKARPGELNYASGLSGSASHLAAELFKSMAGINIVGVPYKSGGSATLALIAGEVQVGFNTQREAMPHVKSGKLRALAVTSAQPSMLFPGVPTIAASGVPGYETVATQGMFAPARTPVSIVNRLNREIVLALTRADAKERVFNNGSEVVASSPDEFAAVIKSEVARMGKVIKDAGIRIQ